MRTIVRMRMIMTMAMRTLMGDLRPIRELSIHQHVDLRRRDAATIDAADMDFSADVQRSGCLLQKLPADACVKQGSQHHVSADSRETL